MSSRKTWVRLTQGGKLPRAEVRVLHLLVPQKMEDGTWTTVVQKVVVKKGSVGKADLVEIAKATSAD